ncbi:MAG: hypothetical protein CHACPFDD_03447 [Phycisphaerae bacterium]|nr:hypothetical protein [Phycisphaerae bacterium]
MLFILLALVLLAATLYFSTVGYALRSHTRSGLADRLTDEQQRFWFDWLDRHENDALVVAGVLRFVAILGVMATIQLAFQPTAQLAGARWFAVQFVACVALLFIFAIAIPNAAANVAGQPILARHLPVLRVLVIALWPVARMAALFDSMARHLSGRPAAAAADPEHHEQEILTAVSEGEIHGAVDQEDAEMIESVFELRETTVGEIVTPRTRIVALPVASSFEEVRQAVVRCGHSRIPVYDDSLDHIVGVVYAKDLLRMRDDDPFDLRGIMRSVPYVPESKNVRDLLRELRQSKVHIAIVLDEYGGTAGLVTIEDIIEELVGEITDEYEPVQPQMIRRISTETVEVDARVPVSEVSQELGIELPEDAAYESMGGFVFAVLGRIPMAGEEFVHENLRFRIVDAEPRRINRMLITRAAEERQPEPA